MRLIQKSPEVFIAEGDVLSISEAEIDMLKLAVKKTPLGRVRINLHPSSDDRLHEMFLVVERGSYIRAHMHPEKSEAFHMVHGSARVVIFEDDGSIYQVVSLDANNKNVPFYYRMSKPRFHTLLIDSEFIVFHEITNGPFVANGTIYAAFSPHESETAAVVEFQRTLNQQLATLEQ
jgi:cupin fold WbuC family metalloprotein